MDSSATYQAEARRRACTFDGTNHLIASAVLLPVSYMLFGEWGTAAAGVIIFFSYLFTPAGGDLLSILLFRRRRPLPAASGVVVVSGGGMDAAAIAALPAAFAFKRDVLAGEGWAQCAICLGLVREGETTIDRPPRFRRTTKAARGKNHCTECTTGDLQHLDYRSRDEAQSIIEAMKKRGIDDMDLVMVDAWCAGYYSDADAPNRRVGKPLIYCTTESDSPMENGYARPVEGTHILVDMQNNVIIEFEDRKFV
ncbi:hypothetical protein ACQ4PT_044052 [Festuca glaucescens]